MWSASLFREPGSTWVCYDSPTAFGGSRAYNRFFILSLILPLFLPNRRSVLSRCLHFLRFLHSLLCQRRGALYCTRHTRSPQWHLRMSKLRQQTQIPAYPTTSATPTQFSKTTTLNGVMVGLPITPILERSTKKVGTIHSCTPVHSKDYSLHRNLQVCFRHVLAP